MKLKLIDDWLTVARRSATTWVTGAVQIVVAIVGVHWAVLLGVLPFVPFWLQLPIALAVAAITLAPTVVARVTAQPKMQEKLKGKSDVEPV